LTEIRPLFSALNRVYHGREEGRVEALLCHAGLLALWFLRQVDRCEINASAEAQLQVSLMRRFLALVENGFQRPHPLTFYASNIGTTTTHLCRTCRRLLGLSALAVVHNRRVLEAKRSLAYTPASIAKSRKN
jgi:AraC family transcriptional activator of pobA